MEQLSFDFGIEERIQFLLNYVKKRELGSNSDWYIFKVIDTKNQPNFFLGIRTNGLGGTDYEYHKKITRQEAMILLDTPVIDRYGRLYFIYEFMNCLSENKGI